MKWFSRLNIIGAAFTVFGVLIIFQIIRIQQIGDELISDPMWHTTIYPDRGNIYDRDGNQLAANRKMYELGIELQWVYSPETIATEVTRVLNLDYNDVYEKASMDYHEVNARYAVIKESLDPDVISSFELTKQNYLKNNNYNLSGLIWSSYLQRSYPEDFLASNVLGFHAFYDRLTGSAHFGVEEKYDTFLSGTPQEVSTPYDPSKITSVPDIPPGANLYLTLDREIQAMVERIIDEAVELHEAQSGTVIVMDPETGEILAMAVNPRINPNEYPSYSEFLTSGQPYNRAIETPIEPGSVFKVLTMAAALDTGAVEPDTEYIDQGTFEIDGLLIPNWDRRAWGIQTMTTCMQHSLNTCLSHVAVDELGAADFYKYLEAFGIGQRTNIDLAGEALFPMREPGDEGWTNSLLAYNSFGQGIATTPIQLITAISAVANEGKIMAPHVLKTMVTENQVINIPPRQIAQPISAETAATLTEMLTTSLEQEASLALVDGYTLAGKTGTAEIAIDGKYHEEWTNTSFIGWGPSEDPKFIVYVWIERPTSSPWGSVVAAPVFQDIVEELVILLDIPPDNIREDLYAQSE